MPNSREIPLEHGCYYHIYNRGINGTSLFDISENYEHFLKLYNKYITPIADTFAWCLMGNHFHLLLRIKDENEIGFLENLNSSRSIDSGRFKWQFTHSLPESEGSGSVNGKKPVPHRMFSHLFNSYTKYFNQKNNRTGSLFEKNFHRLKVTSEKYFQTLIIYIHQNPVHHSFIDDFRDYPWSSYGSIISTKPTKVDRDTVLEWFGGNENFVEVHRIILDADMVQGI